MQLSTRLAIPPRTEGHPYNIAVLNDGTLVASYSARIYTNEFQPSSGVFVSTNDGASWLDRSAAGMQYYTKDLTIDPYDPAQNRWYAGVWGEWGASDGLGGLYATTNRGISWSRITTNLKAVSSCAISPANSNEMVVTTEDQGLWFSMNRRAASPVFAQLAGYPFRFPTRVFFNPFDTNEVWVTSYGNGMRLGRMNEPRPFLRIQVTNTIARITTEAAHGQKIILEASTNLAAWTPVATNVLFADPLLFDSTSSADRGYFRAKAR